MVSPGTTRIAVNGAAGRMGRQLLAAVIERDDVALAAASEAPGQPAVGVDVSVLSGGEALGILVTDDLVGQLTAGTESAEAPCEVIIDFTAPAVTLSLLDRLVAAGDHGTAMVVGATGFTQAQSTALKAHAAQRPLVFAPNYSVGVTLSLELLRQAAVALGDDYDVEVIEAHHRHKVDAPSGTAVRMGEVLADALDRDLQQCAVYGREGITGARDPQTIGFATVRGGDIIGEHTVLFAGLGERLEITHRATERMTFARGAVRAASWLASQAAGLYDMTDVLGIGNSRG